jgi:cyclic 2,3-diphosphoglycerate synthase
MSELKRAVVLIDGVHKPDNSINGVEQLVKKHGFKPVRMVWIGGTEKMKDPESFKQEFKQAFGVEVIMEGDPDTGRADPVAGMHVALEPRDIDIVVQLSGSPQVNRRLMNRFASVAVGYGAAYIAGGTVFAEDTGNLEAEKPSEGLYATDKRVGKTTFGIYIAALMSGLRQIDTPWSSITITHSRGGPPAPPVLAIYNDPHDGKDPFKMSLEDIYGRRFQPEFLERLLDFGLHGASDVYEDAMILSEYLSIYEATGKEVPKMHVVGCRRAGAGYFHEFAVSNVELGLKAANTSGGDFILHEGSGGEHPPARVDGTITLVPSDTDQELLHDFPGLDTTDLIILAHCQPETADAATMDSVERIIGERNNKVPVVRTLFEPEVMADPSEVAAEIKGKRAACFTTAPQIVEKRLAEALVNEYELSSVKMGFSLTRDKAMRVEIDELMAAKDAPEVFLMEIKARGVEGAKYVREKYGMPVFYVNNVPKQVDKAGVKMPDNSLMDKLIAKALNSSVDRFNKRKGASFPLCKL